MKRERFIATVVSAAGAAAVCSPLRAQEDPAISSQTQALRVLLGTGRLQTIDAQTFLYDGRRYRGTATTLPNGQVVSTVPLEQYLYSVVSREMPRSWPGEALQAQAILARTYVLQRSNPNRDYDVVTSEADQVYTGIDAEAAQTNAAVNATAGHVLRYRSEFATIAYFSCCGGHTESSAEAWGGKPLAYLSGVTCNYCKDSQWYQWTQTIGVDRLRTALGAQSGSVGDIQDIALDSPDASGRARFWMFTGTQGSARVKASDVRRAVGSRVLPSLLVRKVTLQSSGDAAATLEGGGLGHGVGFCQWGARGLAQTGANSTAILAYYFPGTTVGSS
ncbi:MAG TPA: SpoIID/LytB domain-containing protein [Candidatus Rubrimentiphilum sp.]|nr:SpoIID/LytB domain-containing protein [Candidatus Rubrimentiphilum sp.]